MKLLIIKTLLTAVLVVLITEVAKMHTKLGALISAMPIVLILTLVWLHFERQPNAKLAEYSLYTFWYVLPTLPMLLAFPLLLNHWGFWPALLGCLCLTVILFILFAWLMRQFGVVLF